MSKIKNRFNTARVNYLNKYIHLNKKQKVLWTALVGIVFLLIFSKVIYQYFAPKESTEGVTVQVQTVRVKEALMTEAIDTIGTLTAEGEVKIKAVAPGRIQKFLVEGGSWVKKGTLLAEAIGLPEVRAPIDGYLTDWLVKPGEFVSTGTDLIDIVNSETLSLTYRVPEQYAPKIDLEQSVEVSAKAFPDKTYLGKVRFISPVVDKKTYTILIRATVQNPNQDLWPGMSAHVKQVIASYPKAVVIPEASLKLTLEGYEVLVIQDGKLEKRAIKIGDRHKGRVHVLSGLVLNDTIVLTRNGSTQEGSKANANDWAGDW